MNQELNHTLETAGNESFDLKGLRMLKSNKWSPGFHRESHLLLNRP